MQPVGKIESGSAAGCERMVWCGSGKGGEKKGVGDTDCKGSGIQLFMWWSKERICSENVVEVRGAEVGRLIAEVDGAEGRCARMSTVKR